MNDFQKRAKEAADELERVGNTHIAASDVLDLRWQHWLRAHGPTALAALRAMAGGQKAWMFADGDAETPIWRSKPKCAKWSRVLIVEEPNE